MHFDYRNYFNNLNGFREYASDMASSYYYFGDEFREWEDSALIGIPTFTYRLLTQRPKNLTELLFGNIIAVLCLTAISLIVCSVLLLANLFIRCVLIIIPIPFVLFFSLTNNIRLYEIQLT